MTLEIVQAPLSRIPESTRAEWRDLAATTGRSVFATPEWHDAVQAGFGDRGRDEVLLLRNRGALVGAAPLRLTRRLGLTVAETLGMGERTYGMADYGGLVSRPGDELEVARATCWWLVRNLRLRQVDFLQVPEGAPYESLKSALRESGFTVIARQHDMCHRVALPNSWAEFRAGLSPKTRSWLEYPARRLERDLHTVIEPVPGDEVEQEFATARRFLRERWGGFTADRGRRWSTALNHWLPVAHRHAWLRMLRLRVDGETVAVSVCYEHGDCLSSYNFTWHQRADLKAYSLGAVIVAGSLRWAIDNGLSWFDFLRGDYDYKRRLSTDIRRTYRIVGLRGAGLGSAAMLALRVHRGSSGWHLADERPSPAEI